MPRTGDVLGEILAAIRVPEIDQVHVSFVSIKGASHDEMRIWGNRLKRGNTGHFHRLYRRNRVPPVSCILETVYLRHTLAPQPVRNIRRKLRRAAVHKLL